MPRPESFGALLFCGGRMSDLAQALASLEAAAQADLAAASDVSAVDAVRVRYLGRKGSLAAILRGLGGLDAAERPLAGKVANEVKTRVEAAIDTRRDDLVAAAQAAALAAERLDVTLPGRPVAMGRLHPSTQMLRRICQIWANMGFQVYRSRDVETDEYNFELLNIPPTTRRATCGTRSTRRPTGVMLRTHTSPGQIHAMREFRPEPIRVILPGMCYRYEQITARSEIQFHQVEGLAVGRNITMTDLKGTLIELRPPDVRREPEGALPRQLLPVHRAERRGGRGVLPLRRQRLRGVQADRLAGDPGLRHGASPGAAQRRLRSGATSPASPSAWGRSASPCCCTGSTTFATSGATTCASWSSSERAVSRPRAPGSAPETEDTMHVPISWLKEFVDIPIPIHELAERLTFAGLEVASVETVGLPGSELPWDRERMVVGRVREVVAHPNADRLVLATVEYGPGQVKTVVTGAPNLKVGDAGQKVAFALEGARLWDAYAETRQIATLKGRKIRGVYSDGMVCSEQELGLSESHEGVLILEDEAPVGTPLAEYLGDEILELEILPNMARCLSVLGVAREVAALTGGRARVPEPTMLEAGEPIAGKVRVAIADPGLSARYAATLISGVHDRAVARLDAATAPLGGHAAHQQRRGRDQLRDAGVGAAAARLRLRRAGARARKGVPEITVRPA